MRRSVKRFEQRRRRWRADGGRTLVTAVTITGIGWLVVVPSLAGFAFGRWIDARYGTGIVFAAGLGMLGLVLGCAAAWRHVTRTRGDGDPGES
jgi:ATP synthase protein I